VSAPTLPNPLNWKKDLFTLVDEHPNSAAHPPSW